jgi:outer membrane protein assembly factor BamE (lipoprotein component of BamABCDE complex)
MRHGGRSRITMNTALLGLVLMVVAGCGTSSESKAPLDAPDAGTQTPPPTTSPATPAAQPAPSPPPSLREAGAQIADEAALKELVQGKTTKAEVRERFGIPQEIVLSPGYETFIYYRDRTSGWISRTTERIEMLTVRFDAQGVLKDFEYRFSGK